MTTARAATPRSPRAHFATALALDGVGNREQALKSLEKALELEPKYYEAAEMMKRLKKQ